MIHSSTNTVWPRLAPTPAMMKSKTNTATVAPTGSIKIPSQRKTEAIFAVGRTFRSSGAMTVGPVTMISAPKSSARSHGSPIK